jgi:hypothetical protein
MRAAVRPSIHDILIQEGYKLIDDGWEKEGRKTYLHDENASSLMLIKRGH